MIVVSATTLEEALAALAPASASTRVLAGGTDLMVELQSGRTRPDRVVDVRAVPELRGITEEQGSLRIGALATCGELLRDPRVARCAPLLQVAAREVGAVQIQNRATIGGNLGSASPAADLVPVLFALGARVELVSARGRRVLAAEEFVTGYRSTARAPDELIAAVSIPARRPGERQAFRKVGTRRAQSIAKVVVALSVEVEDGRVRTARVAAGSVAARTLRLAACERALEGAVLGDSAIEHAARAAADRDAAPRDDVRSSALYRRVVLARVLATMLRSLA